METKKYVTDWSEYPPLPENADDLINDFVQKEHAHLQNFNFGGVLESKRLARYQRGKQLFAVFRTTASELTDMIIRDDNDHFAWRPATLNGVAFDLCPDEGRGGVLHWMWCNRRPEWVLVWHTTGWIYASELDKSPTEVRQNIINEIDAGLTPLTGLDSQERYK